MTDDEKKVMRSEPDHTPPPADPSQVLSPKRRSALVMYLAILFAVAFLLVAVMMVVETQKLKTMNQELKDSSQKTSATLTGSINALQEENQKLAEANEALTAQIQELEQAAAEAGQQAGEQQAEIERLTGEQQRLEQEKQEIQQQLQDQEKRVEDAITVSELLQSALAADEEGDLERLQELLDQIEPLKELLSPTEADIYEELKIAKFVAHTVRRYNKE